MRRCFPPNPTGFLQCDCEVRGACRLQLFEFEDLSWFPGVLRGAMTRYLGAAITRSPLPALWVEELARLGPSGGGAFQIVDLGSRSGGAIGSIVEELRRKGYSPEVTLTDLYPDPESFSSERKGADGVQYWPLPVNAECVPPEFGGVADHVSVVSPPPSGAGAIHSSGCF
jgi:hypothetical protein